MMNTGGCYDLKDEEKGVMMMARRYQNTTHLLSSPIQTSFVIFPRRKELVSCSAKGTTTK